MKITIVQGAFYPVPALRGGAIEKIWFALGKEFARRGHTVTHYSRLCDDLRADEMIEGVHHVRIPGGDTPVSRLWQKWLDWRYTRHVARLLEPADVVVTHTFWAPVLFSRLRHGPVWVHVQRYPKGQMWLYRHAARLQTVSRVIAEAIIRQTPSARSRVCVIKNPSAPLVRTTRPVVRDSRLVLFVGRIHPEKGIELLIAAAGLARLSAPHLRFRIVGPAEARFGGGGEAFLAKLVAQVESQGAAVEFTGPVFDEAELAAHYASAAVFVYPSLAAKGEASPVAPLEALARGCPVVTSDLACFDDSIGSGLFSRRFDHTAPDAAARLLTALTDTLANQTNWARASAAAVVRARDFSIERIATEYLAGFATVPSLPETRA